MKTRAVARIGGSSSAYSRLAGFVGVLGLGRIGVRSAVFAMSFASWTFFGFASGAGGAISPEPEAEPASEPEFGVGVPAGVPLLGSACATAKRETIVRMTKGRMRRDNARREPS